MAKANQDLFDSLYLAHKKSLLLYARGGKQGPAPRGPRSAAHSGWKLSKLPLDKEQVQHVVIATYSLMQTASMTPRDHLLALRWAAAANQESFAKVTTEKSLSTLLSEAGTSVGNFMKQLAFVT